MKAFKPQAQALLSSVRKRAVHDQPKRVILSVTLPRRASALRLGRQAGLAYREGRRPIGDRRDRQDDLPASSRTHFHLVSLEQGAVSRAERPVGPYSGATPPYATSSDTSAPTAFSESPTNPNECEDFRPCPVCFAQRPRLNGFDVAVGAWTALRRSAGSRAQDLCAGSDFGAGPLDV